MKKSLIALAVLAASGAAMAQSSVSLYGVADVWFGSVKDGAPGARTSQTVVESGGVTDSRWGLKGSEDLGGGLKANFLLEQGFNLDSGAFSDTNGDGVADTGFNRQAYVSLSSNSFGEVKLGKVATAYDSVSENTYSAFDSALSAPKPPTRPASICSSASATAAATPIGARTISITTSGRKSSPTAAITA